MNTIEVLPNKSIYEIYEEEYLDFYIDGIPLNALVNSLFPGKEFNGLVPPFSMWLDNEIERQFAIDRIIPTDEKISVCPILICPDDQCLSCTTLVTMVSAKNDVVNWDYLGSEISYEYLNIETFGNKIDWFGDTFKLQFDRDEYIRQIKKNPEFK